MAMRKEKPVPIVISQLSRSDQIFQALLVPVHNVSQPSLVLTNRNAVFICDFFEQNGLQITRKLSVMSGTILRLSSIQLPNGLSVLTVLVDRNELYVIRYEDNIYKLERCVSFMSLVHNTRTIDIESPIIATNDKYVIVHSERQMLTIMSVQTLLGHTKKSMIYPLNKFDVVDIKFISSNKFQLISRNSAFQFNLTVLEIMEDENIVVVSKQFNAFKELPKQMAVLPGTRCTLVICDGTHLIYPPPGGRISKNVIDASVKLTRVSTFKVLEKELAVTCCQVIDDSRVLIVTEEGELYMEHIKFVVFDEKSLSNESYTEEYQLQSWKLFKLGDVSPSSNILHINDNLFLNYSKESKNCFFRINPREPYISILNYFQLDQFFEKKSMVLNVPHNVESTAVVDISKISLINTDLFIKVQSSIKNSYVSFKYNEFLDHQSASSYRTRAVRNIWFHGSAVIYQTNYIIRVLRLSKHILSNVKEAKCEEAVLQCFYPNNELIIVTPTTVTRNDHILYQCEPEKCIILQCYAEDRVIIVTNDEFVHELHDSGTTFSHHRPDIACIEAIGTLCYMGFKDGTLRLTDSDNVIHVSKSALMQLVLKPDYILAVDSDYTLHRLKDGHVDTIIKPGQSYRIKDVADTDGFLIRNDAQLSYNIFDERGKLVTDLYLFYSVPSYFEMINDELVTFDDVKGRLRVTTIRKEPIVKISELHSKKLIRKSLFLRVNVKFPILMLITSEQDRGYVEMVDLESFKIMDIYQLKDQCSILDIIRTDFEISTSTESLDLDLTEKEISLVQMELRNNGFLINTSTSNGTNCLKLFSIGSDMKIKFHYSLETAQRNNQADIFKLASFRDCFVGYGTFLLFFQIELNDKFKSSRYKDITEDNFLRESIFKIVPLCASPTRAKIFITDVRLIGQDHIVVVDVLKGLTFYKVSANRELIQLSIKCDNFIQEMTILAMEVVNDKILILADALSNVFIYGLGFHHNEVELSKKSFFNLNSPQINVIKSLDLVSDRLCLIGCSNGEVLMLEMNEKLDRPLIDAMRAERLEMLLQQNLFIDTVPTTDIHLYRLRLNLTNFMQLDGSESDDVNWIVDLRSSYDSKSQLLRIPI